MLWEEKIDRIKRVFHDKDFSVPFTEWSAILQKIEAAFVIKTKTGAFLNSKGELKHADLTRTLRIEQIYEEIIKLQPDFNYWAVLRLEGVSQRHFIYDAKMNAILALLSIAPGSFYIVDKKYEWLLFFEVNKALDEVKVFRCDKKQE